MAAKPTIQLRTIFLIFVCAAIGLTCATSNENRLTGQLSPYLYELRARQNLCRFFLYTFVAAMIMSLIQQIRDLARLRLPASASENSFRFAWLFAMGWRALITIMLCICAIGQILLVREKIQLPDGEAFFPVFPDILALIGAIVVLSNSNERWRVKPMVDERWWMAALAFVAGVILLVVTLKDIGVLPYLVHIAVQGIEHAQPGRFQRPGAFPDQEKEGFRLYWLSIWASVAAVIAAAALLVALAATNKRRLRILCLAVYAIALGTAAAFCVWYYRIEVHRISPDFAVAGLAGNWIDRIGGLFVVATVISLAAYRTATKNNDSSVSHANSSIANRGPYFHEFAIFILLIVGAPLAYLYEHFRVGFQNGILRLGWQRQIAETAAEILAQPQTCIYLAVLVLSIQLLWRRWKRRADPPALKLMPIESRRFVWTWAALAMLAAVALPTFSIFSFTCWLGPWYLH